MKNGTPKGSTASPGRSSSLGTPNRKRFAMTTTSLLGSSFFNYGRHRHRSSVRSMAFRETLMVPTKSLPVTLMGGAA